VLGQEDEGDVAVESEQPEPTEDANAVGEETARQKDQEEKAATTAAVAATEEARKLAEAEAAEKASDEAETIPVIEDTTDAVNELPESSLGIIERIKSLGMKKVAAGAIGVWGGAVGVGWAMHSRASDD